MFKNTALLVEVDFLFHLSKIANTACISNVYASLVFLKTKQMILPSDDNHDLSPLQLREGFNNPSHGNCPLGGYPPPPGAITDDIFPKS